MALLHPVFPALMRRPELLLDHAAGYLALMREEAQATSGQVISRVLSWAVAVLGFIMFVVLAGVAAMLGAMQGHFHWVLLLVPGTALALAAVAFAQARQKLQQAAFAQLRSQLEADAQALRTLRSPT